MQFIKLSRQCIFLPFTILLLSKQRLCYSPLLLLGYIGRRREDELRKTLSCYNTLHSLLVHLVNHTGIELRTCLQSFPSWLLQFSVVVGPNQFFFTWPQPDQGKIFLPLLSIGITVSFSIAFARKVPGDNSAVCIWTQHLTSSWCFCVSCTLFSREVHIAIHSFAIHMHIRTG